MRRVNDFSPSSTGRKRVPDEFEVHVDRFVIVTVLLFAKRFILIYVARERTLFQGARFWDSRNCARVIRTHSEKRNDTAGHRRPYTGKYTGGSSRSCLRRLQARSLLISTHEADRIRLVNSASIYTLFFPRELSSGFLSRGCDQYCRDQPSLFHLVKIDAALTGITGVDI